jgi:hypothetical protein
MRTALALFVSSAALAVVGCNAILGNDPGVLAIADEAGADPVTAPEPAPIAPALAPEPAPEPTAMADAGLAESPAPSVAPEAGVTCPPCVIANGIGVCVQGACVIIACSKEHADCNANPADGCETNLTNDHANCGACGMVCPPNATCKGKTCRAPHEP